MEDALNRMLVWLAAALFPGSMLVAQPDHSRFSAVLAGAVQDGLVDYQTIRDDERFHRYLEELSGVDPESITDDADRLAFWINAYNGFTIRLITDHLPLQSIRDISVGGTGPWDIVWIEIGGKMYSLNQIEHEIIRPQFREPRIHMALVCAARGCPPLLPEAYTGRDLESQLKQSGRAFVGDPTKNRFDEDTGVLYLSELFNWYGDDFTDRYGSAAQFVLGVMGRAETKPSSIRFLPYDWSLNSRR